MNEENKTYLGDSVYAEVSPYGEVILTTENRDGPTNTIVLEYQVYFALIAFCRAKQLIP